MLKTWSYLDVLRLLNLLMLKNYLSDDSKFIQNGSRVNDLRSGLNQVQLGFASRRVTEDAIHTFADSTITNKTIVEQVHHNCYIEISRKCRDIAKAQNSTTKSALKIGTRKLLADSLPTTAEAFPSIKKRLMSDLIKITKKYAEHWIFGEEKVGRKRTAETPSSNNSNSNPKRLKL